MRTKVFEIELAENLGTVWEVEGYDALHILARYHGKPIGWLSLGNLTYQSVVSHDRFREALTEELGWSLARAVLHKHVDCTFVEKPSLEPISIVVCTRDRTDQLAACLDAVQAQDYPCYEIIIVDNAPSNNDTARLTNGLPIKYVHEPRPGLNWARNRGVTEARHSIVAFTDDDVRPDRYWLRGIGQAFTEPGVMAVTGLIAPAELETNAQHLFEFVYGGMGKGFQRRTFRVDGMSTRDLLWANAFGVGANMAFRREVFSLIGGFDVALDVGTPAGGAGDLDMFHRLVAKGCTLVYDPSVLVWHVHRRSNKLLQQQLYDNGRSFGAYLLTCIRNRTVSPIAVLGFIAREWLGRRLIGQILRPRGLPRRLILMEIIGALRSPIAYRAAQAHARKVAEIFDRRKTLPQAEVAYAEGERSVSA
jgi:GT2 family glycosyltransferase